MPSSLPCGGERPETLVIVESGQPKVEQIDAPFLVGLGKGDEDVAGFDVVMNDVILMGVIESRGDGTDDGERFGQAQWSSLGQDVGQRFSRDVLLDQSQHARFLDNLDDAGDGRVI